MLTHADVCGRMRTYAGRLSTTRSPTPPSVCGRMLMYADVCGRMLADYRQPAARHLLRMRTYADVCGRMLADYRQPAARHLLDLSACADRASKCHCQYCTRTPGGRHNCDARPFCVVWEAHSVWRAGVCEMRVSYHILVYSNILILILIY